jgi:hypothetical protein
MQQHKGSLVTVVTAEILEDGGLKNDKRKLITTASYRYLMFEAIPTPPIFS